MFEPLLYILKKKKKKTSCAMQCCILYLQSPTGIGKGQLAKPKKQYGKSSSFYPKASRRGAEIL